MTRRTIGLLATLALSIFMVPLAADLQPPVEVARIGVLGPGAPPTEAERQRSVFWHTLRELGWSEGQNLAIEQRYAEGQLDRRPDSIRSGFLWCHRHRYSPQRASTRCLSAAPRATTSGSPLLVDKQDDRHAPDPVEL